MSAWQFDAPGIPTVDQVAKHLDDSWWDNGSGDSPWLNHRGRGTPWTTRSDLQAALSDVAEPVIIGQLGQHRTKRANAWEIDASWQATPPDGPDPGRPTVIAALAFIGVRTASRWPGHWIGRSIAIGHLWDGDARLHPPSGWIVSWRRRERLGVPTAGPLRDPAFHELRPPTWPELAEKVVRQERK